MDIKSKIERELKSFSCLFECRIATVGTSARESEQFAVLPRRSALGYEAINFLVTSPENAAQSFSLLDSNVQFLFVDIESKKEIDLMSIAKKIVKKATIIAYKPNDTTLEAADLFLRHHFHDDLVNKNIMIYGAGNLGSKLALRLAERGSNIYLSSRNNDKTKEIVKTLNYLLPKYSKNSIKLVTGDEDLFLKIDSLISFTSSSNVIPPSFASYIKKGGLALDGGINNFSPEFILKANESTITCYRLDVRAAFPHTVLYLIDYIRDFYTNIQGEEKRNQTRLVAGGIIGNDGDIVVDRIKTPAQIVGVANGVGGLKAEKDLTAKDQQQLNEILQQINKYKQ
ncbi:hypothetical protein E2R51_07410 [Jeotgalibacillus sp. S-D1]|uniref:NAD(P)-binding domain-containing protein n=1 Tax=Jeotgalibacillus sp. S-D1 TaxID=2552189 RepID=UPI00105A819C|nr:NAD(P)-binding domain-containing protein [Jeotgalibacillus sp. S-D1]TDL32509.1 hypothetical protein E2R51_07410 [Jeotgalibacillus sp. S-D1]